MSGSTKDSAFFVPVGGGRNKRDSVMRFLTIFFIKRFVKGPIWIGKIGFTNFFVFANSCVRVVNYYAETVSL